MATLKLVPDPTFRAKVGIPVAGGDPATVSMTFKHRTTKELDAFIKSREDKLDIDTFFEMVVGWDLTDEFNRENVEKLLQNYGGAALAIYQAYVGELIGARIKN